MAWQNTSSFPLCPGHRPGPTLLKNSLDLLNNFASVPYGRARAICVGAENPANACPPDNKIAAAILRDLKTSL